MILSRNALAVMLGGGAGAVCRVMTRRDGEAAIRFRWAYCASTCSAGS
ncbi:MAG: hypothetical protein ACLSAH_04825 [Bilophila wadsworthia]